MSQECVWCVWGLGARRWVLVVGREEGKRLSLGGENVETS